MSVTVVPNAPTTPPSYGLIGVKLSANLNSTADQAIVTRAASYIIRRIIVANASGSLSLAAGGVYDAASKAGNALVAATQLYAALTGATKSLDLTLAAPALGALQSAATLYLSLTTAQGTAMTADVYIYGELLS